jgi:hypothetical protein
VRRPLDSLLCFIGLLVAATVTEAVLAWITSLMSLPKFFPAGDPGKWHVSLDFETMLGVDWLRNAIWQVCAFAILFAAFLASLWLIHRSRPSRRLLLLIFLAPVAWTVTAAFMYPPYARDLFHNLADARLIWVYHLNPMLVGPSARPFPISTSYGNQPSAYGPVWYLLSFPGAVFQPNNFLSSIILLKLWMGAFYLASGWLIYLIVKAERPRLAPLAAAVYLWNPFVIVRDLGDAHNDVVMVFFVLAAFYLAQRKLWLLVLPALALSVLVKWASIVVVPVFVAYVLFLPASERRKALPGIIGGGAIALWLVLLVMTPFWAGLHTFDAVRAESDKTATSTPHILEYLVTGSVTPTSFAPTSRLIMRLLFVIPYALLLSRLRPPAWRLHAATYQALLLYLLIAVAWFRPWYFLWVVSVGALLPWGWFLALTLTISWFGMFPEIIDQYSSKLPWLSSSDARIMLATILATFLVPALLWLAGFIWTQSWFLHSNALAAATDGDGPAEDALPI